MRICEGSAMRVRALLHHLGSDAGKEGQWLPGGHPTTLLTPPLLSLLQGQSQGKEEKYHSEVFCSCLATATQTQEISVNELAHTPLNASTVT